MLRPHWITVAALTACSVVLVCLYHEAVHALVCAVLGGEIRHFSAVHVNCSTDAPWKFKLVAASGSLANLLLAAGLWPVLRRVQGRKGHVVFFVWQFFLVNLLVGTGYWFASGLTGTGDWAAVISGMEPRALYQIGLLVLGTVTLMGAVAWALVGFGRIISSDSEKPIGRAQMLAIVSYITAIVVMLIIGMAQPGGPFAFPGIAGLIAVAGGLSPLLWMMQWFRADMFKVTGDKPLEIERSMMSIVLGIVAVIVGVVITLIGQAG